MPDIPTMNASKKDQEIFRGFEEGNLKVWIITNNSH